MKSLILHGHEVRQLQSTGAVQLWRPLQPQPWKDGDYEFSPGIDKFFAHDDGEFWGVPSDVSEFDPSPHTLLVLTCPYGQPAETRWVRETWAPSPRHPRCRVAYRANQKSYGLDGGVAHRHPEMQNLGCVNASPVYFDKPFNQIEGGGKWTSASQMPHWASRYAVTICTTAVRRVQSITIAEARAAGIPEYGSDFSERTVGHEWDNRTSVENFGVAWNFYHAKLPFTSNPWAWCVDTRKAGHQLPKDTNL